MPYPKSGDLTVGMKEEFQLYPEGTTDHGFMDWGWMCHVVDENGTDYYMDLGLAKMKMNATWGAMPFGTEDMDSWNLSCNTEKGKVFTPRGQIFKLADFKDCGSSDFRPFPGGSMKFEEDKENERLKITLDAFTLEIDVKAKTWHATVYDDALDVGVDFTATGVGYPFWYSKDEVRTYVDHLASIGYNWQCDLEGELNYHGEKHHVHGLCSRERTVLPDQSNVEAGAWMDLIMFKFDEMRGALMEYKLSEDKDTCLYINEGDQYFATADPKCPAFGEEDENMNFEIIHEDWAFLKPIGVFIPTTYIHKQECEVGTLVVETKAVGAKVVASRSDTEADCINLTLDTDEVKGTFYWKDGRVQELHNGFWINNIVVWRAYPSWIPNFGASNEDFIEINPMKG